MSHKIPDRHLKDLYRLLASIRTPAEAELLLDDLATPQELEAFAERWQLVKLLARGMTQRDISSTEL